MKTLKGIIAFVLVFVILRETLNGVFDMKPDGNVEAFVGTVSMIIAVAVGIGVFKASK